MPTGSPDDGVKADLGALGRRFEAGRIRALERCGSGGPSSDSRPDGDACLEMIERLAGALGIDDATVLACGGVDLARWRGKRKVNSPEYRRRLDAFMVTEFEKDGRPLPNVMQSPYGWYARKKAHFDAMYGTGPNSANTPGPAR